MKKNLIYEGLGFPVLLENIEVIEYAGEELPQVNHPILELKAFQALITAPFRITGNQLLFIRGFMKKSQSEFASDLGMKTHSMISNWQKKADRPTEMSTATELAIRMYMAKYLGELNVVNDMFDSILKGLPEITGPIRIAA